jgi:hypothetical protein
MESSLDYLLLKSTFESCVKLLGRPLSTLKPLRKFRIQVGYVHGTHHPKSRIDLCKASLTY